MLSLSISYWDLINFPYFADTTERGDRGWKEAQIQGADRVTLWTTLAPNSFKYKIIPLLSSKHLITLPHYALQSIYV
jgi:hypothetical protein